MKPSRPLAKKYGKLTVLSEHSAGGRRHASVRCQCKRVKDVLADSLLSGRTTSCGRGACKSYARNEKEKGYVPQRPRSCDAQTVEKAWNRYHHKDPGHRRSIDQLAQLHDINPNTLTSLFRTVRRAGGIKAYMKAVQ